MITKKNLDDLYDWALNADVPLRVGPTAKGYSNNPIFFCWLKKVIKTSIIRQSVIKNEKIIDILSNDNILFSMIVEFTPHTLLGKHKDPNVYQYPYKRIQIPLNIPDKEKCYMIWNGEKVRWHEGIPQVYEVMDHIHEGYNKSDFPMKFLFVDVKKDAVVEIE